MPSDPSSRRNTCPRAYTLDTTPTRSYGTFSRQHRRVPRRASSIRRSNRSTPVPRRAEIGTTFISEALTVPGVTVVGPLPGDLHNVNTYTAAIHAMSAAPDAARALLRKLTDPASAARWTAAGLQPAFP